MSRNRRRHQNKVPIASLSPIVLLAGLLLVGGITWIYMKHQLVARGSVIAKLEGQIRQLNLQNQGLNKAVEMLSSHTTLKKRLADGFIQLEPVEQSRVLAVQYRPGAGSVAMLDEKEIVPVANRGVR